MVGLICKRQCEENKDLIVEIWGIEFYQACITCDDGETFLGLLVKFKKI